MENQLAVEINARLSRIERAILGDPTVGHIGLVQRVEHLERANGDLSKTHQEIDNRRVDGDRRLHERFHEFEDTWSRRWYLALGAAAGVGVASGYGGTWLFNVLGS